MTAQDEILLRIGMDSSQLANATATAIRAQKDAAAQYEKAWNDAINATTTAQATAAAKQVRIAQEQMRFWHGQAGGNTMVGQYIFDSRGKLVGRAKEGSESWIKQRHNERMATSVPEGWGNIASQATVGGMTGGLSGAVQGVEFGAATAAADAVGKRVIASESLVLVREALRRNWSRMIQSFLILLQRGFGITARMLLGTIGEAAAIAVAAFEFHKAAKALRGGYLQGEDGGFGPKGEHGSLWAEGQQEKSIAKRLGKVIDALHQSGQLSGNDYKEVMDMMHIGGFEGQTAAQRFLMKKFPHGWASKEDLAAQRKQDSEGARLARAQMAPYERYLDSTNSIIRLRHTLGTLDKGTTAYNQTQLDIGKALVQQYIDLADARKAALDLEKKTTAEKEKQAKAAKDLADKQDTYNQRMEQLQNRLKQEQARADVFGSASDIAGDWLPSVNELASGNAFMTRANGYKRWLAANSPFKGVARDLIRSQLELARDVSFGAGADVISGDETRVRQLRGVLSQAGFLAPDQKLDLLNDTMKATTDEVARLNATASRDGIVIKAGN